MSAIDAKALAEELMSAYSQAHIIEIPPSGRDAEFDLTAAYAVEAELTQMRRMSGHRPVGWKVGYANKAVWRVFKLETLVWAHMYDDTVSFTGTNDAQLAVGHMCSPKIEPEIVFKLKEPIGSGVADPVAVLQSVEWLALGFEIIDCVFAGWKFQPADFVAAFGLHAALVVGQPQRVEPDRIAGLVDQLAGFKVNLYKDGQLVEQGSGRNSLRSPALCLAELASAIARRGGTDSLAPGALVSSGTLTESRPIAPHQTWKALIEGLELPDLTLRMMP